MSVATTETYLTDTGFDLLALARRINEGGEITRDEARACFNFAAKLSTT